MSVKHLPLALPQACEIHLQLIEEAGLDDTSLASDLREACVAQNQVLVVTRLASWPELATRLSGRTSAKRASRRFP